MNAETQEGQERSSRGLIWVCLCWLAVIVVLYVLSIGPVMKITLKKNIGNPAAQFFASFYKPLGWAYANTLLHKPLGIYYHLWIPRVFDSKGNISTEHLPYQSEEPIYENHRLSEWLAAYRGNLSFPDKQRSFGFTDDQVEKALDAIGEKAFPFLMRWLQGDLTYANFLAITGFQYYGPITKKLQPALIQMTLSKDSSLRDSGYEAFYFSQPDKDVFLPVAYRGLRDPDAGIRGMTAQWLIQRFAEEADKAGLRQQYPQFYSIVDQQTNNASSKVDQ
ncbi:MAG: hypothetical protein ACLQU3_29275 [Limisphaerales bacterium]